MRLTVSTIRSWVMLSDRDDFTPLPGEQKLYKSPARTSLSIKSPNQYPGNEPFSVQSSTGCVYLTNRRIVYLPSRPTPTFQSFTSPILNLRDTHVAAPFFGPNVWTASLLPVQGGGIHVPSSSSAPAALPEVKLTFKDGGAFDFHTCFERVKERLVQAIEAARESGVAVAGEGEETGRGRGEGALEGVSLNGVHLEDLPRYEERDDAHASGLSSPAAPAPAFAGRGNSGADGPDSGLGTSPDSGAAGLSVSGRSPHQRQESFNAPAEPPPGYEEVQIESVADELERRLRRADSRGSAS
ncbi:hypothetical protein BDY21DRAFT_280638 [Lineolata rhizophorae]|uniref:WW-domain-binding protein n=1 Tax=Lineolata rhizophorae TaxID=578093 RepID=A0A6A6PAD4_9PEZI|nr:hypothetical protein BDY21DRAFT_280638 [Lineolata rhizophorae]